MSKQKKPSGRPSPKEEANKFDKIFKENIEPLIPVFLRVIIGLKGYRMENPPKIKLQVTLEKEPDFIRIIFPKGGLASYIFHLELETSDGKNFNARMLFYLAIIFMTFRMNVEQHVIYLLEGKPKNITGKIKFMGFTYHYQVHCITDYSYRNFIGSEDPEVILLSVLADHGGKSGQEILRMILHRLVELRGNSEGILKFIKQLRVLSMLRKLRDETDHQIKEMNFTIPKEIIEADYLFKKGEERGMERGMEKGMEKSMILNVRNLTQKGYGANAISDLLSIPLGFVRKTRKQLEKEPQVKQRLANAENARDIAESLGISVLLVEVIRDEMDAKGGN